MYTKRQTVWLVSMLSLMVVLSAYYLFTEDVNELNPEATQVTLNEVKIDQKDISKLDAEKIIKETAAAQDKQNASSTQVDAEVLKKMTTAAASGREYFDSMQMKKIEDLAQQSEKWMKVISDSKAKVEDSTKAQEEMYRLSELEAKLTNIEELLMKDFANAVVLPDNSKYKVIVQANKLEKSQAVSIVDLVMTEMQVGPDKISIQYEN
jgi:stage III sporulation protein AH